MSQVPAVFRDRLLILDALRGFAALLVCWTHLVHSDAEKFPLPDWVVLSGFRGDIGVQCFFVISGFIVPYALHRARYEPRDYGRFILKRLTRLEPPYLVAILLCLVLGYLAWAARGYSDPAFNPPLGQIFAHLGYLNLFVGYEWFNAVFWTLAIELQFYITMGLIYPAVASESLLVRALAFGAMAAAALLVPAFRFMPHWLFHFAIGIVCFQFRVGIVSRREFSAWLPILTVGAVYVDDVIGGGAAFVAALLISFVVSQPPSILLWLGASSYSLYLVHMPIGAAVQNLAGRFVSSESARLVILGLSFISCLAVARGMYRWVELPAQRWSSRFRYKKPHLLTM